MYNLEKELRQLEKELVEVKKTCEKALKNAPTGKIRISGIKNGFQCYLLDEETIADIDKKQTGGKYIKKKDIDIAYKIAQRDYDKKLLKKTNELLDIICDLINHNYIDDIKNMYSNMNVYRQCLTVPRVISDKEYIDEWLSVEYEQRQFNEDSVEIYTEKGERVLSKSEKIIADKLFIEGIPYLYEPPLYLEGYGIIHPDFKVLNAKTRKEMYWEHLGMMDDEEYIDKAIKKIELYQRNGYLIGRDLILTHETRTRPLNVKVVKANINEWLK